MLGSLQQFLPKETWQKSANRRRKQLHSKIGGVNFQNTDADFHVLILHADMELLNFK